MQIPVVVGKGTSYEETGTLTFYLYESPDGERKLESKHSVPRANNNFNGLEEYTGKIYPWLQGMNFKDIPSYWDVTWSNKEKYVKNLYKKILSK